MGEGRRAPPRQRRDQRLGRIVRRAGKRAEAGDENRRRHCALIVNALKAFLREAGKEPPTLHRVYRFRRRGESTLPIRPISAPRSSFRKVTNWSVRATDKP